MAGYPCCCTETIEDCAGFDSWIAGINSVEVSFAMQQLGVCTDGVCSDLGSTYILTRTTAPGGLFCGGAFWYELPSPFLICGGNFTHVGLSTGCFSNVVTIQLKLRSIGFDIRCTIFWSRTISLPASIETIRSGILPLTNSPPGGVNTCWGAGSASYDF